MCDWICAFNSIQFDPILASFVSIFLQTGCLVSGVILNTVGVNTQYLGSFWHCKTEVYTVADSVPLLPSLPPPSPHPTPDTVSPLNMCVSCVGEIHDSYLLLYQYQNLIDPPNKCFSSRENNEIDWFAFDLSCLSAGYRVFPRSVRILLQLRHWEEVFHPIASISNVSFFLFNKINKYLFLSILRQ